MEAQSQRPLLVVVNGPPGAGKTTIARVLADEARLPLFSKDQFKDALFDALGTSDRDWSATVGRASVSLLFEVAATELGAGRSLVIDNTFVPRNDQPRFEELQRRCPHDVLQIWCTASTDVLFERFRRRAITGERHPGHIDDHVSREEFAELLRDRNYSPLPLQGALLEVDTTDLGAVDYDPLLSALRNPAGT